LGRKNKEERGEKGKRCAYAGKKGRLPMGNFKNLEEERKGPGSGRVVKGKKREGERGKTRCGKPV